jgi:CRP-like cAMP-binding protein
MSRNISSALSSLQGFQSLDAQALETLSSFVKVRAMRAGETIFCQGEPSPYFFGILSGEVTVQRVSSDRRFPKKILGVVGVGELFGESAIFEDSPRAALASSSQDGELLVIRGTDFREWLKKNSQLSQPLLFSLLRTSLGRLHRTSHELSVVYGIGRIFGSARPFSEQLMSAMDFLKTSLEGLDDIVFYQRSAYWEEFEPLKSLPMLQDLPSVPVDNELVHKVHMLGSLLSFDPQTFARPLDAFKLDWQSRASAVIIPLLDWEKAASPLQGLLLMASAKRADAFSTDRQLLLTSLSSPIAEALARNRRIEEAQAQSRLQKSRQSYQA